MFKLYRVSNEKETEELKKGIVNFEIKDKSLIEKPINTFDYGKEKSESNYKKHFFLFEEDAFTYSKYLDVPDKYVNVFAVPDELVFNNIGIANIRDEFFPLEVAISSKDLARTFYMILLGKKNPYETLDIRNLDFYIGEKQITQNNSISYYAFNTILNNILLDFYENDEFSLEIAKKYFEDDNNRKYIVQKVKEYQK